MKEGLELHRLLTSAAGGPMATGRGWLDDRVRRKACEESPDSMKKGCRVTPGGGNPRESATENRPPRLQLAAGGVRVKRWGKSPPRTG